MDSNLLRGSSQTNIKKSPKHMRNRTEPKIKKNNFDSEEKENINTSYKEEKKKNISQYFEESISILNTIHYYLDKSAKNNSIPLMSRTLSKIKKDKRDLVGQNYRNRSESKLHYRKLSYKSKGEISNKIENDSIKRKKKYIERFNLIDQSIEEIKKIIMTNYPAENRIEQISDIIRLSTINDEESFHYDGSERKNTEKSMSIIYNDDDETPNKYDESLDEKKEIQICPKLTIQKNSKNAKNFNVVNNQYHSNNNISTNFTTLNDMNNLIANHGKKEIKQKCIMF